MSSAGRAASSSGCVGRPRGHETGLTGYAEQIQRSLPTGSSAMETAEHREPYESRGSRTDLGAPGGESPPGDSTSRVGPTSTPKRQLWAHKGYFPRLARPILLQHASVATIGYYLKRTGIPVNFGITVALGFIVGAAVVGQTFYIFVIENLRQFGALKAMGVANGMILRMVLLQAIVVASIGYAIGIGLCAGFFEITSRISINLRGFELPWQVAAGTACAILVIIVIASFASIRKVMVVDPAIVFRG